MIASNKNDLEKNKKINLSLNVIKCLAIFSIICIHCGIQKLGTKGLIIDSISRFAVPIFFLISGYFSFYTDNNKSLKKYKTRIIRLIKLLIVSNILYFIYYIITNKYDSINRILSIFYPNQILKYLIFNISPTASHLWFIEALIYCYVIYYILSNYNINKDKLYKYIPILLLVCLMMIYVNIPKMYYQNFLFMGLPFFTLGYFIHDKKEYLINKASNTYLIIFMILGCLLTILEAQAIGKSDIFIGSSIILSTSLFLWCIKNPYKLNFKISGFIGGNLYAIMYVLHLMIIKSIFHVKSYLNPIIAFIITAIVSYIIYLIINLIKKKN